MRLHDTVLASRGHGVGIEYETLRHWRFPDVAQSYSSRDAMLYALGCGLGLDPADADQLRFVYEDGLRALPTMAVVLGYPGFWLKDPATGVDWRQVLHGEQGLVIHRPLDAAASIIGRTRVTGLADKGAGKGALLFSEREIVEAGSGALIATLTATTVLRGDGGFGGPNAPSSAPPPIPERKADLVCDLPTSPMAALIYRLSGDDNPLHADPQVAAAAGFARPILHGLATFGVVGHALLKACCGYQPTRLRGMRTRFSAPVYPGETIRTEIWRNADAVAFRARVVERDIVVLNNGRALIEEN